MEDSTVKSSLDVAEIIGDKRDEILALAAQHNVYNVRVSARRRAAKSGLTAISISCQWP